MTTRRNIGNIIEDDGAAEEDWLKRQTPVGLLFKGVLLLLVVGIIVGIFGLIGGWLGTGAKIISPQNVTAQWQFAYEHDRALTAIAQNWCSFKKLEDSESNPDFKVQRQSQTLAQETNYNRVQADYNAQLANAFRAKLVKPPDVPSQAPTLAEKVNELGCYP